MYTKRLNDTNGEFRRGTNEQHQLTHHIFETIHATCPNGIQPRRRVVSPVTRPPFISRKPSWGLAQVRGRGSRNVESHRQYAVLFIESS